MEDRLGTRITVESDERKQEMRETRSKFDELTARVANIEAGKNQLTNENQERAETRGGWRAAHLILGFEPKGERAHIEFKAKKFMQVMGDAKKHCLTPWAPKRYGSGS